MSRLVVECWPTAVEVGGRLGMEPVMRGWLGNIRLRRDGFLATVAVVDEK
jgi:hypothetical protein